MIYKYTGMIDDHLNTNRKVNNVNISVNQFRIGTFLESGEGFYRLFKTKTRC